MFYCTDMFNIIARRPHEQHNQSTTQAHATSLAYELAGNQFPEACYFRIPSKASSFINPLPECSMSYQHRFFEPYIGDAEHQAFQEQLIYLTHIGDVRGNLLFRATELM